LNQRVSRMLTGLAVTLTLLCQGTVALAKSSASEALRTGGKRVYPRQTVPFRVLIAVILVLAFAAPAFAADPLRGDQWGLAMIKAEGAWATSTGIGAEVAVIDTGAQFNHPDLTDRLLTGYDYVGRNDDDPSDENGHGTHVTGLIVANRDNDEGITGVAPGAKVLPLRVLDENGEGLVSDTVEAVRRAIEADVDVINLSLGDYLPLQSKLMDDPAYGNALESAVGEGIVVVVAAGNNMLPHCENPEVDGILCVGAVNRQGLKSSYSSFGSEVDLMAPGGEIGPGGTPEEVLSTWNDSDYFAVGGTSQATPHVAAVAALLVSLGVTGQDAVNRIVETAAPAEPAVQYGAGILDAAAAVEGLAPPPPPPDPGDPDPAAGSFSVNSPVKRRVVRRRGFEVTCEAGRPGRCKVVVRRRGRRIARGGGDVPVGQPTVVAAKLGRAGRRLVKRMGRRLRVRVAVTLPGEATKTRRVVVTRRL
jgi:serine protease